MATYREHKETILAALLLSSNHVASCDHSLHIWDINKGLSLLELPAASLHGQCLHLIDDGRALLVGTGDGLVKRLDCRAGKMVNQWRVEKRPIYTNPNPNPNWMEGREEASIQPTPQQHQHC